MPVFEQLQFSIQKMARPNFQQYQEFQDYTNYIDTSDVMLGFYKNQSGTGLEKYYLMIEEWLNMQMSGQDNKPLVIQGDSGVGKKTLLVKWYEYHQSLKGARKNNDLIILHFATAGGNNSNYFYAIYRILIKLREELNIDQKVELHQEKLRKYFSYWLDVCNQRIENQAIKNLDVLYNKIILVFEGIDCFQDRSNGKEGNIAFWLPKLFPKNVKVIVSANRESESMKYFTKLGCQKVNIPYDINIMKSMMKNHLQKRLCVNSEVKNKLMRNLEDQLKKTEVTCLFVKSYLNCLLPQKLDHIELAEQSLTKLQNCLEKVDCNRLKQQQVDQLFDYLLQFWGKQLFTHEDQFHDLISLLISTQKGLTRGELLSITKIHSEELNIFLTIFKPFLMNFGELWMIKNQSFKKSIQKKYKFVVTQINEKIADILKKTPNSVRKLEQQTFQLYSSGNYFKLKEVISDIQNFLLLFNPYTKYDLCRYWQKLQERSFDPVIQYNKAIEGFQMHYHPTSDDLFRIITQISRFLREFSDFQTYYTPEFRHPKLIGNSKELQDIGVLGQFRNLSLCQQEEPQQKSPQPSYEKQMEQTNENEEEKKLKRKLKQMYEKIEQGKHVKKQNNIQVENTTKTKPRIKKPKESRIQQLNVQVKSNENQFRQHYYNEIKGFLQKVSLGTQVQPSGMMDNEKDEDYQESEEQIQSNNLVAKIKNIEKEKSRPQNFKDLKNLYAKTVVQQFELNQKPPTNYYYKRWIWMQFPWVCMTMKCDYSDKLRKCFTSPTSYMSVAEEREFTIQALKIALEAKKKKQAILQKAEDAPKLKKVKNQSLKSLNGSVYDKLSIRQKTFVGQPSEELSQLNKTKKSKKMEQLSFVTHSFLSLHNLSKQIDNITNKDDTKNSVFITAQNAADYSNLLHSFQKKKGNSNSVCDLNGTKTGLLPRIKQNANKQMMKQLQQLQKNNESIRRQMDSYLYKNKILAKRLKELKIIQYNNQNQLKNQKKVEEKKQKITEIQEKIEKVKYQYAFSLLEHQRLNVLIKICRRNKTHNEEAIPDLVLECNNFKKMIKIQSEVIQQLKKKTDQIKKLTKKFVANCCERIQNQTSLQRQIQQTFRNRQNFQGEVEKYDSMIVEELQQKRKQLQQLHHNSIHSNHESLHQKPKKNCNSEQDQYLQAYKQLEKYINLENDDYSKDPQYIKLLDGLSKKRQFETVLAQRKMQLEQLQKKYEQQKRELQTLNRAKDEAEDLPTTESIDQDQVELTTGSSIEQLQKQLHEKKRILTKTTAMKLECLGMLNTLYIRLGLPEQPKLTITPEFLQKIEEAKILSKVQSC